MFKAIPKWINNCVKEELISCDAIVETTYGSGPSKKIKEFEACYVFSPNKTNDRTKISLTLLPGSAKLGIAKIETVMNDFSNNNVT